MSENFKDIKDFIQETKYDYILNICKKYVRDNYKEFYLPNIDLDNCLYMNVDDIHLSSVYTDKQDDQLLFSISVQCDLSAKMNKQYDYEQLYAYKYLTVKANGSLKDNLKFLNFFDVDEYNDKKFDKDKTLSKNLLPYIYNEDLDNYATKFLKDYCEEALLIPMPLPIDKIVAKLGLTCIFENLDSNIFGKMFFRDATINFIGDDEKHEKCIKEGTILINKKCFFMKYIGSLNNTIIHECLHWYLHRNFFKLLKIINPDKNHIECESDIKLTSTCDFTDSLKWMEWQASSIAPKVLIPRETGVKKFNEILKDIDFYNDNNIYPKSVLFNEAIHQFADFFEVSTIAAKIRLIELGFSQAIGSYNYINGVNAKPYYFKKGSLNVGESYQIDDKSAAIAFFVNEKLHNQVLNHEIIYVDHSYVLNNEKYINYLSNGKLSLSTYALDHMDECCIKFDVLNSNCKNSISYFNICYLCRNIDISQQLEYQYNKNNTIELDEESLKKVKEKISNEAEIFKNIPSTAGDTIKYHLKRKKLTQQKLANRSKISLRTLGYYISPYDEFTPNILDIVAICIGLNLSPDYSKDLIKKFGLDLDTRHDELYNSLRFIIECCHFSTIEDCNKTLTLLGCKKKIPGNKSKN